MSRISEFATFGRKIIAIGSEHAKELGNAVPKEPFFFLKPSSSFLRAPGSIEIPKGCNVHHEVELGVVIGKEGRDIPAEKIDDYVAGYVLAIDVTARNLQDIAKKEGKPWSAAKGFDTFTPVGEFIEKSKVKDVDNLDLWLKINGKTVQSGNTKDMMFKIPTLIHYVSSIMKLEKGDVILTGTPSGVGPMLPGSILTGGLKNPESDGLSSLPCHVSAPPYLLLVTPTDIATIRFPVISRPGIGLYGTGKP
ncbi:hypothetical protein HDU67_005967 [Dinochytrium kinnereticum]|nr:hypothetical protein HDU67_005967 [Dinochytrium kinnereticum]